MEVQRNGRIAFGPYVFDTRADLLLKHGMRLKLQPQPRAILKELLSRPGELVTREQLREILWPDGTFVDFNLGVNVAVKKLRDALCDSAGEPMYIETAPGEGYRFIGTVEHIYEPAPESDPIAIAASGNGHAAGNGSAIGATIAASPLVPPSRAGAISPWLWSVAGLTLLVMAAVGLARWRTNRAVPPLVAHQITWNAADSPVLDAAISPSGRLIAVVDGHGVSIENVATGESHAIAAPDFGKSPQLGWLPDSAGLLLCGSDGIWSISLLGGSFQLHGPLHSPPRGGCAVTMSPDRAHIAFLDSDGIWITGPRGEDAHRIVTKGSHDRLGGPTWSPDGSRIAYSLHRQTPEPAVRAFIQTCDINGGSQTTIDVGFIATSRWVWLPDHRIIFVRPEAVPYAYFANLWAVPVDPHSGRQLSEARELTDWPDFTIARLSASADGQRLLFLRPITTGAVVAGDIGRNGQSSGPLRTVTNDQARDRPIAWSRDGKELYILSDRGRTTSFYRLALPSKAAAEIGVPTIDTAQLVLQESKLTYGIEQPKLYSVYRRDLNGGPAELVLKTDMALDYRCALGSESCVIADVAGGIFRLGVFNVVNGQRRDLATLPWTASPVWNLSADGSRVAVVGMHDPWAKDVEILDVGSGKVLQTIELHVDGPLIDVTWAGEDGLIVTAAGGIVSVDGRGHERVLWHYPRWLRRPVVSADGRQVAFSESQQTVNAWMANF